MDCSKSCANFVPKTTESPFPQGLRTSDLKVGMVVTRGNFKDTIFTILEEPSGEWLKVLTAFPGFKPREIAISLADHGCQPYESGAWNKINWLREVKQNKTNLLCLRTGHPQTGLIQFIYKHGEKELSFYRQQAPTGQHLFLGQTCYNYKLIALFLFYKALAKAKQEGQIFYSLEFFTWIVAPPIHQAVMYLIAMLFIKQDRSGSGFFQQLGSRLERGLAVAIIRIARSRSWVDLCSISVMSCSFRFFG